MSKKYELTNETLEWNGRTLHRIRALRDFGRVRAGDLGGWVESERNLSHRGTCWLYNEAKAYDNSGLFGNARAYNNAELFENAIANDNARLFGHACASGHAQLSDNTRAFDNAHLSGDASAYDRAHLSDDMCATRDVVYISGLQWPVTISDNHIKIGCEVHEIDEWAAFSDEEIAEMGYWALEFWKGWGNAILTIAGRHQKEGK